MFKVGEKIQMIKVPDHGWYSYNDGTRMKIGDVVTIYERHEEKFGGYSYTFDSKNISSWLGVDNHFISINELRKDKLKRLIENEK